MARLTIRCAAAAMTALLFVPAGGPVAAEGVPAGTWRIDPARSVVQFTVTKLGFADVEGPLHGLRRQGALRSRSAGEQLGRVSVRVASVLTDARNRDRTLQEPEYFDAARHPDLRFRSTRVRGLNDRRLEVDGDITIKGITRPLRIVVSRVDGGFETAFELDRFEFEIVGGRVMRHLIGRTVRVRLVAIAGEKEDL